MSIDAEYPAPEGYSDLQRRRHSASHVMAEAVKGFLELCRVEENEDWPDEVSIYQQNNFLDLCHGFCRED